MDHEIAVRLVELNRQFYQSYASSFSHTRHHVQPGVSRLLHDLIDPSEAKPGSLLDLGCGNGDLVPALQEEGFSGSYLGVDFSTPLMNTNQKLQIGSNFEVEFRELDLSDPIALSSLPNSQFDICTCFAVLHHLPGDELRRQFLKRISEVIKSTGIFCISVWQFSRSAKLASRILPWHLHGFLADQVDRNDFLLDWRAAPGEIGVRYVHEFTLDELTSLIQSTGFDQLDQYYSDGKTGDLSLYQVWQKPAS